MCSNSCDCDELSNAEPPTNGVTNVIASNVCKTCGEVAHLVLRKRDPYCKTCFIVSCTHKFRSTLGKSKLLKPGDRVLVAFSGGPSSAAMLQLLRDGFSEEAHKRLLFDPSLVYIDDSAVLDNQDPEMAQRVVVQLMKDSGFPYYTSTLDLVCSSECLKLDCAAHTTLVTDTESPRTAFTASYQAFKTLTDRESFYKLSMRRLLLRLARDNGFVKVFTAETGTFLAATLLSTIALGRGAQLREEAGFLDDRDPQVQILRPMREFSSKEVALFNVHRRVPFRVHKAPSTARDSRASIARLTGTFVNGLQEDFPATVSTVWRTGDKIASRSCARTAASSCRLCGSPLDTLEVAPCSAVAALELTRDISRLRVADAEPKSDVPDSDEKVSRVFCYSCQALVRSGDANALLLLPDITGTSSDPSS